MKNYVKISTLWRVLNEKGSVFLINLFKMKMFSIDDPAKQDIILKIRDIVPLHDLESQYKEVWNEFRRELEDNYVIYYSSEEKAYNEPMQIGGRLTNSSKFISNPPNIERIYVEFAGACGLSCDDCSKITAFPCLSCFKNDSDVININLFKKVIKEFSRYGIRELYITGGDPLLSYSHLIECIREYLLINGGRVVVITNGSKFLSMKETILSELSELRVMFLIQVVDGLDYSRIVHILNKFRISYELMLRNSNDKNIEFDSNCIEKILINKGTLVTKQNLKKPIGLYENTYCEIKNRCFDGKIYIKSNGDVCVCKGYSQILGNLNSDEISEIINKIEGVYLYENLPAKCLNCGVVDICYSCSYIREKFHEQFDRGELCDV